MEEKKILNKLKQGDIVELIYIPPKGKKGLVSQYVNPEDYIKIMVL